MPKKIKVLLVEDDEAIREMYRIQFEFANIPIAIAETGTDAYKLAKKLRPDLLLLDLKIPKMTGEELLQKLHREKWAKDMKVVILSNINPEEAPAYIQQQEIERYMVKAHYTPKKVVKAIAQIMRRLAANN